MILLWYNLNSVFGHPFHACWHMTLMFFLFVCVCLQTAVKDLFSTLGFIFCHSLLFLHSKIFLLLPDAGVDKQWCRCPTWQLLLVKAAHYHCHELMTWLESHSISHQKSGQTQHYSQHSRHQGKAMAALQMVVEISAFSSFSRVTWSKYFFKRWIQRKEHISGSLTWCDISISLVQAGF